MEETKTSSAKPFGGRNSKLNQQLIADFALEIEAGLPTQYVCDLFGINQTTHLEWMTQGKYDDEMNRNTLHRMFYIEVKRAYAKFIRNSKTVIRTGAQGWQGMAWWLERTNRDFQLSGEANNVQENIVVNTKMKPTTKVTFVRPETTTEKNR